MLRSRITHYCPATRVRQQTAKWYSTRTATYTHEEKNEMQELINKRLEEMLNLKDRAALRDALNDVFLEIYEETEGKYSSLEQRVRDELPFIFEKYAVYNTVLPRTSVDAGHVFLNPMITEEMEETIIKVDDLIKALEYAGSGKGLKTIIDIS